jgi:hypothetical protein
MDVYRRKHAITVQQENETYNDLARDGGNSLGMGL